MVMWNLLTAIRNAKPKEIIAWDFHLKNEIK
jgi:hypothetical protein